MAVQYTNVGPVRGGCGHNHQTIMTAARCSVADSKACHSQGGYSDRNLRVIDNGELRKPTEAEYLDYCDCLNRARYGGR
jgi:hypothetical protein